MSKCNFCILYEPNFLAISSNKLDLIMEINFVSSFFSLDYDKILISERCYRLSTFNKICCPIHYSWWFSDLEFFANSCKNWKCLLYILLLPVLTIFWWSFKVSQLLSYTFWYFKGELLYLLASYHVYELLLATASIDLNKNPYPVFWWYANSLNFLHYCQSDPSTSLCYMRTPEKNLSVQ